MSEAIRGVPAGTGDDAVRAATGRTHAEWFPILDEAGAASWTHQEVTHWLSREHRVPNWWTQNVTVAWEQARGMRAPGQRADGTFEVTRTRTIDGELPDGYAAMVTAFTAEHGDPTSARAEGKRPYARWKLPDETSILATAEPAREGRVRLAVVQEKLPSADATGPAKDAIGAVLNSL